MLLLMLPRCSARSWRVTIASHWLTGGVLERYSKIHFRTAPASRVAPRGPQPRLGQYLPERVEALRPVVLRPGRRRLVWQLPVLDLDLGFRHAPSEEAELDRRVVRPGEPHGLVTRRCTDGKFHIGQPARPRARVAESPIQPGQRHREHLALGRLERAVATLADRAQALDALLPHGDRLRPPPRDLVLLGHVLGDPPMRSEERRVGKECERLCR